MSAAPAKRQSVPLKNVLLLSPHDNVLVALADLPKGERLQDGERAFALAEPVQLGHKIARVALAPGSKVIKYGACIGAATQPIAAGAWVHLHNLASEYLATAASHSPAPHSPAPRSPASERSA